ncbi:MAG: hypothetical protein IKG71_08485 [Firmicutes bacterium]|nr:hypothetical protein [Bacillota bacterium]
MGKHNKTFFLAIIMAGLLASSICLSGCDLFGINDDDGGDIQVTEKLDVPESKDNSDERTGDTGLENSEDPDDPTLKDYDNGIFYPEEAEGAQIKLKNAEGKDFVGSWEAKSGNAHFLFGNMELKIREGGFWTGNITEENYRGTWNEQNGGIYLKSADFEAQLNFTADNKLLLRYKPYEDSDDYVTVILTNV